MRSRAETSFSTIRQCCFSTSSLLCQVISAPIRSRRSSSGGGGRQKLSESDQAADRALWSQPAAGPRTNRSGRTPPPGQAPL
jgi:hypothetical protein